MNRFVLLFLTLIVATVSMAVEKTDVYMKAKYESVSLATNRTTGEPVENRGSYVLQIARNVSYFYDPQTYYVDSLENDPSGSKIIGQVRNDAWKEYMETGADPFASMRKKGVVRGDRHKNLKDFSSGKITVWDSAGGDEYRYEVDMNELEWEIGDSVKNVAGYECGMATADYHGRRWVAWFAPEVTVQDGPWQLCGLPGLIMEAETADGEYGFRIVGLQKCDESLKKPYKDDKHFKLTRESFLKAKAYSRENRLQQIGTMTGGAVKPKNPRFNEKVDLIETDYR